MESGGVKHPHDTPPYPFMPSPTFDDSSIAEPSPNVINLMDALKRSVATEKKSAPKSKKRIPGQGEMLLPISGKGGREEPKKIAARPAARRKAG